ncbi:MAG: hypothetical protein HY775_05540 [Acidobacteria bacterium]|nr:hypothetical protein [Acidobacteriota bacterium]
MRRVLAFLLLLSAAGVPARAAASGEHEILAPSPSPYPALAQFLLGGGTGVVGWAFESTPGKVFVLAPAGPSGLEQFNIYFFDQPGIPSADPRSPVLPGTCGRQEGPGGKSGTTCGTVGVVVMLVGAKGQFRYSAF